MDVVDNITLLVDAMCQGFCYCINPILYTSIDDGILYNV